MNKPSGPSHWVPLPSTENEICESGQRREPQRPASLMIFARCLQDASGSKTRSLLELTRHFHRWAFGIVNLAPLNRRLNFMIVAKPEKSPALYT